MSTRWPAQVKRTAVTDAKGTSRSVRAVEERLALSRRRRALPEVDGPAAQLEPRAEVSADRDVVGDDLLRSLSVVRDGHRDRVRLQHRVDGAELGAPRDRVARLLHERALLLAEAAREQLEAGIFVPRGVDGPSDERRDHQDRDGPEPGPEEGPVAHETKAKVEKARQTSRKAVARAITTAPTRRLRCTSTSIAKPNESAQKGTAGRRKSAFTVSPSARRLRLA